jgi:hypothetical protein
MTRKKFSHSIMSIGFWTNELDSDLSQTRCHAESNGEKCVVYQQKYTHKQDGRR